MRKYYLLYLVSLPAFAGFNVAGSYGHCIDSDHQCDQIAKVEVAYDYRLGEHIIIRPELFHLSDPTTSLDHGISGAMIGIKWDSGCEPR